MKNWTKQESNAKRNLMSKKPTAQAVIDLPHDCLKPHTRQRELFPRRPDWQLQELADDMAKNGQLEDIEVLPDRTVVSGHGRVEAATGLGWKTVRCWVRYDLAEAGPEAI